jgi:hypothetical protein
MKKHSVPDANIQSMINPLIMQGKPGMIQFDEMTRLAKFELALPEETKGSLPPGTTIVPTFKGQLERMKKIYEENGIKGADGSVGSPEHINEFTKIIDGKHGVSLVNSDDPSIVNTIAHNVFGPGNENAFKYFGQNVYDDKGNQIPGRQALFNRFSHPDVVKQIIKHGTDQTKSEYYNFMTITAREDLLRTDLPRLKEAINTPNSPWQLAWDTDKKELKIIANPNLTAETRRTERTSARSIQLNNAVKDINQTLNGLKSIATTSKLEGDQVDGFVLAPVIASLGDISGVEGVPQSLATTIRNAYTAKKFQAESEALNAKSRGIEGNKSKYTQPSKGE